MDKTLKMLLVEDNPGDAFLIKFYLEESTFKNTELIHEEFLYKAIKVLETNSIQIILLDLNLSDSSGVETLEQILAVAGDAVVIVLTGLTDEEIGRKALTMGAHDFLVKGQFDSKVLNSSLKYVFESTELKTQIQELKQQLIEEKLKKENLATLFGAAYWEYNSTDKSLKLSQDLKRILGSESSAINTIDEFVPIIEDKKQEFKEMINLLTEKEDSVEITLAINNLKYICLAKSVQVSVDEVRIIGILKNTK